MLARKRRANPLITLRYLKTVVSTLTLTSGTVESKIIA